MSAFSFVDNLDDGAPLRIRALVELVSTSHGGRQTPIGCRYRPNHNFGTEDNRSFYIGQVELPEGDQLAPGEQREVLITFLSGPGLREKVNVGTVWRIQEGEKLVGTGKVLEVLSDA